MKYEVKTLDGLDDSVKGLYSEHGSVYRLKVEGLPKPEDVTGLKNKVDELLKEKKTEQAARKAAEKKAQDEADELAKKTGDVDALNTSWETKYNDAIAELTGERDEAMSMLHDAKVHTVGVEMATALAIPGSAGVLLPHIEPRLSMDIKDGRANIVVLDAEGKPSALTVDELGKEIASNKAFAPLIVASNAAGGGAKGGAGGKPSTPSGMGGTKSERVAVINERLESAT